MEIDDHGFDLFLEKSYINENLGLIYITLSHLSLNQAIQHFPVNFIQTNNNTIFNISEFLSLIGIKSLEFFVGVLSKFEFSEDLSVATLLILIFGKTGVL